MKTKTRILALLLAVVLLIMPLASCNKNDDDDTPTTDDEFTGFTPEGDEEEATPETPSTPALSTGDENAVIEIYSYEDLVTKITQKGTFYLKNDITISAEDFKPLGNFVYPFLGTFDGQGNKIILTVSTSENNAGYSPLFKYVYSGLFGVTRNATIKDLNLEVNVSASSTEVNAFVMSGGIAGYMINTTVENCNVTGTITSKSEHFNAYAGGISGIFESGKISNCTVGGSFSTVESKNRSVCGGLIGYAIENPTVENCIATASIKASVTQGIAYAGGIVANAKSANFVACQANAPVYAEVSKYVATSTTLGAAYAGGIVAVAGGDDADKRASFTRCYALENDVTAIGNNHSCYAAGIAAMINYANFKHCYSLNNIKLKTGLSLAYAASGFALINSAGIDVNKVHVPDFSIEGCFATGNLAVEHTKPHLVFYGTVYGSIINTDSLIALKSTAYCSDATFTLNSKTTLTLSNNGIAKPESFFTLSNLIAELGWTDGEWEYVDNVLTAK